jgi:hypothetical protein
MKSSMKRVGRWHLTDTSALAPARSIIALRSAIIADLPNLTPGAMGFRAYHLKHHWHQGDNDWDADPANHWEARLVGNKWYRKAIWLMLVPFFQITRPPPNLLTASQEYRPDSEQSGVRSLDDFHRLVGQFYRGGSDGAHA